MALLQATRILPQQRIDLPDYRNIEDFVCADFKAIHKNVWTDQNYVVSGFASSGTGTNTLTIEINGSTAIYGNDDGVLYIGAPSLADLQTTALTPASTNYIELYINKDTGGADSRAFWDQTANAGAGAEFSQIVDTFSFTKANINISTSSFSGDVDKLRVCEVDVNGSGIITQIRDARNQFWRLGTSVNPTFSYSWASRTEPVNTQFTGADKDIKNMKDWANAVMSRIKEITGLTYWYEANTVSLAGGFRNAAISSLVAISNTARIKWTGSDVLITDASLTPLDVDQLAALRLFDTSANLMLTRQDGVNSIPLADNEILWIEIPAPLTNRTYDTVGVTSTNYRISARGALPLDEKVYWLAYREGSKLIVHGIGELEAGEESQIGDNVTSALLTWLGFNPEIATSVPYTAVPNSLIFGLSVFNTSDHLVKAISVLTANMNALGAVLATNAYAEPMMVTLGLPANDNEIQGPVVPTTQITIPLDSRDSNNQEQYIVGDGILKVFLNGNLLYLGDDYNEVGTIGNLSDKIEILIQLDVGDKLQFRIDSVGGFNVGAGGGGGDVTGGVNIGVGQGLSFKQKTAGILEFRKISAGAGIAVSTVGDDIVISVTGGTPEPYFVNYITGQTGTIVNTGSVYNLATDKLDVYRNGILMLKTLVLGSPVDRYTEITNKQIQVSLAAVSSEVFTFVNQDTTPTYKNVYTGLTGVVLTVPTYVMGNDSLKVYRNGVFMNASGFGVAIDQYSETSTTSITLATAAVPSDIFTITRGPTPTWREDLTGITGTTAVFSSAYLMGTQRLLIFKNGVLMLDSVSLATSSDRYQELSSTSIQLEVALTPSDVITGIYK